MQLSDWDSNSEAGRRQRTSVRRHKKTRIYYIQSLNDAEFTFRFRLTKEALETLLHKVMSIIYDFLQVSSFHQLL